MYKEDAEGLVFNIQKFSIHDGPGIRSIVFLKGCTMSCMWCSNPESQKLTYQIMNNKTQCLDCDKCSKICKNNAIDKTSFHKIDVKKCESCGNCVEVCPSGAMVISGESRQVKDVLEELKKDSLYYRRSNGGITLSGGEPLLQPRFSKELLKGCKSLGWHTAMETAMYSDRSNLQEVISYVDLFLLDIKSMDDKIHREFTGVSNETILDNIKYADSMEKDIIVRVPVINDFNCDEKSISDIANFAKTLKNIKEVHLLPYHNYGENKYQAIGKKYELKEFETPTKDVMDRLKKVVEEQGITCNIGS